MLTLDDMVLIAAHATAPFLGREREPGTFFEAEPDPGKTPAWPDAQAPAKAAQALAAMFRLPDPAALPPDATLARWAETLLGAWDGKDLVFHTSGSQGEPVGVAQRMDLLAQEAAFLAELLGPAARVRIVVPLHHIYGFLFGVLLPKALGCERIVRAPTPSAEWAANLAPGDLVVGFPLFWKGMARIKARFAPGARGTTSTGPCPAETVSSLLDQGLERMTEIYGSSETGGIGYRHNAQGAYHLFPHWTPSPGRETRALDRDVPGRNKPMRFELPDEIQWVGERRLLPVSRKDKAVQVGGVNVSPEAVRRVLLAHPLVADCAVRLDPDSGRLAAFVVPAPEAGQAKDVRRDLEAWMRKRLSPPETPRSITFGPKLPTTPMGKPTHWKTPGP